MWEITIVGESIDLVYFAMLEESLKKALNDKIVIAISFGDKLACSIAVRDRRYLSLVKDSVFECIIKSVKDEYFEENIDIRYFDPTLEDFVKSALIHINLQEEIDFAKAKTNLPKMVHIRSFVRFRLQRLMFVWKRLVHYLNISMSSKNDEFYLDFLKLLATTTQPKSDLIYLESTSNNMCIFDKNQKLVSQYSGEDEIGVLVGLIIHAPKKIIINCVSCVGSKVYDLIKYIFEDRISIIL